MGWDAIGGIAGSLLGPIIQNDEAAEEARKNREFQANQSRTAHQREVQDLRRAGLNPILSATGGSGASTPAGNVPPVADVLSGAVTTALEARRLKLETKKVESETQLNEQSKKTLGAEEYKKKAETAAVLAEIPAIQSSARYEERINNYKNQIIDKIQGGFDSLKSKAKASQKNASERDKFIYKALD